MVPQITVTRIFVQQSIHADIKENIKALPRHFHVMKSSRPRLRTRNSKTGKALINDNNSSVMVITQVSGTDISYNCLIWFWDQREVLEASTFFEQLLASVMSVCHYPQTLDTLRNAAYHYDDIIMSAIASLITSLTIVYSIVYPDADQRKHQSSASLAFVWGIHRGPVNSPHKWPVTRKMLPFDDVIMWYDTTNVFWGRYSYDHVLWKM